MNKYLFLYHNLSLYCPRTPTSRKFRLKIHYTSVVFIIETFPCLHVDNRVDSIICLANINAYSSSMAICVRKLTNDATAMPVAYTYTYLLAY